MISRTTTFGRSGQTALTYSRPKLSPNNKRANYIRRITRLQPRKAAVLIFAVAFIMRVALVFGMQLMRSTIEYPEERIRVARALAEKGYLGDPYRAPTGPTTAYLPANAVILAAIHKVFGDTSTGVTVRSLYGCAVTALAMALIPIAGAAIGLPGAASNLAGIASALVPLKAGTETSGAADEYLVVIAGIILLLLANRRWRTGDLGARAAATYALVIAAALYTNPAIAPIVAAISLYEAVEVFRSQLRSYAKFVLVFSAMTAVGIAPWLWRTYTIAGRLCLMRCSFGLELQVSNRDGASVRITDNFPAYHPSINTAESRRLAQMGEGIYFHSLQQQAMAWIASHPAEFSRLTAGRIVYFWFPWSMRRAVDLWIWAITALAIAGLALSRNNRFTFLTVSVFLLFPPVYYVVQGSTRYRVPIEWLIYLSAAYGAWQLWARLTPERKVAAATAR